MYNPLHTATEHNCHAWIMYAHISRWHGLGFIVSFSSPLLHWPVTILFARTFSSFPNAFSADVATTVMVLTGWYAIHSFTTAADAFECDKERCVTDNTASPFCSLEPTNYFYGSGLGYLFSSSCHKFKEWPVTIVQLITRRVQNQPQMVAYCICRGGDCIYYFEATTLIIAMNEIQKE